MQGRGEIVRVLKHDAMMTHGKVEITSSYFLYRHWIEVSGQIHGPVATPEVGQRVDIDPLEQRYTVELGYNVMKGTAYFVSL
jgi:hypothetical protein